MTEEFYTSVARIGNNIVYRGYKDGERVQKRIPFKPTMFSATNENSEWKTLDGNPVKPIVFDNMAEATAFSKKYENLPGASVYGINNFVSQYIYETFPNDIQFNRSHVNVGYIDIEVASDDGFPLVENAAKEVVSIAYMSEATNDYIVWGLVDFDLSKSRYSDCTTYVRCETEVELLNGFLNYWSQPSVCPDIITGWFVKFFDIPYLVNRICNVLNDNSHKKLSPWNVVREKSDLQNGRELQYYDLVGIETLDYQDLFKSFGVFAYGPQESYKLDHISHVVLGEKKLSYEEHGNLHTLYKEDPQKFIDYNIKDVYLVRALEDKLGLITLAMSIGCKVGGNFTDCFGTTAPWDTLIYRTLSKQKIVVPQKKDNPKQKFEGGYVKAPMVGRHKWVVSFDLNSLYPHLMMQYNMSPETVEPHLTSGVTVKNCLDMNRPDSMRPDCCISANGVHFRKDKRGIIPQVIEKLYAERKEIKKEMLLNRQKMQTESSYELDKKNATLDTQQMAIKIMMNSLYGAIGNRWFRYYDLRIAESITKSGQLSILWAEKAANKMMNKIMQTDNKDYVIAMDTDSLYINFGPLVEKFSLDKGGDKKTVSALDKICKEKFEPVFKTAYENLADYMNAYSNRMVMEREVIADSGIWTAKKRYILNVHNSEGVQYDKPKMKIMGIEAIKSSTPNCCREALKALFPVMIKGTEEQTQEAIRKFKEYFFTLPAHEVAFPRGVSNVDKWSCPHGVYVKGTPINSKASLIYNKTLVDHGLETKYQIINNGEKIKYVYLKEPNPVKDEVIAFPNYLPEELDLGKYIDYQKQFGTAFLSPVEPVLRAVGWKAEQEASLDAFFS